MDNLFVVIPSRREKAYSRSAPGRCSGVCVMKALPAILALLPFLALGLLSACTSVDRQTIAERDKIRMAEQQRLHAIRNRM
jgi:hypothetical protein